jgi:hypothetical protein
MRLRDDEVWRERRRRDLLGAYLEDFAAMARELDELLGGTEHAGRGAALRGRLLAREEADDLEMRGR